MLDGKKLRLQRLKAVEGRAIHHQNVSLCLSVYRNLVAHTTEYLVPTLQQFTEHYDRAIGRPSKNAIAVPYIKELGIRKTLAIAISTVVNSFHRPNTFQAVAVLIGNALSFEWQVMQEDDDTVKNILAYVHRGAGTQRKKIYLRQVLKKIKSKALNEVPFPVRAALGGELLSMIARTALLDITYDSNNRMYNVVASRALLEELEERIDEEAEATAVLLPSFISDLVDIDLLIKPQRGFTDDGSQITHKKTPLSVAAKVLNNTEWTVNTEQYELIKECAKSKTGIFGLPPAADPTMPSYRRDMSEEERHEVRRAIAKLITKRNVTRSQRTRLLSTLMLLKHYLNKKCYFGISLDFRGRIYTASEHLSYQGPDWLRSVWEFHEKLPITTPEQRDWLYIHAANCFGLSRLSYTDRINYINFNKERICAAVDDPWKYRDYLEQAKHPFRFIAACREVRNFSQVKYGMLSSLPVQMDASSQGIQIWATLCNDKDLMYASNVLPSDDGEPRDIYSELATDINTIAMTTSDSRAEYFRVNPVERDVTKKCMMIIPYGGSFPAIKNVIDSSLHSAPPGARSWLSSELWMQSMDRLSSLVSASQKLSQAAREALKNGDVDHLEWLAPSGMLVKQRYMKDKRIRIKNSIGQMVHSYREETDELDIAKNATAFPPNLIHSIDASILSNFIFNCYNNNKIKDYLVIHDCVGVHASNAPVVHRTLQESFLCVLSGIQIENLLSEPLDMAFPGRYDGCRMKGEVINTSQYLFS